MGDHTPIEWVVRLAEQRGAIPATWNPIDGCSRESPGCQNCFAARLVYYRLSRSHPGRYAGLTDLDGKGVPRFTGAVRLAEHVLDVPLRARKPRVYFVNDMSDTFHPRVRHEWLDRIFGVMLRTQQHLYLLLTKRPDMMRAWIGRYNGAALPNVWLGVSVTDQREADAHIPQLLATPAAKRFVSAEPLLGPVDLTAIPRPFDGGVIPYDALDGRWHDVGDFQPGYGIERLDWVILGGEMAPDARIMEHAWAGNILGACEYAGVPAFFKKWGNAAETLRTPRKASCPSEFEGRAWDQIPVWEVA
jgi:protein gp37